MVLVTCADYNEGSKKTILALDGKFEKIQLIKQIMILWNYIGLM